MPQQTCTKSAVAGPDAFRLIAEFLMSGLDVDLKAAFGTNVIGAARHVDDYYIGLGGEAEALAALSVLRDTLQRYSPHANDSKTSIMKGVEPLNDLWAQELRQTARSINSWRGASEINDLVLFLNKAVSIGNAIRSDSPVENCAPHVGPDKSL
ncbi:MAG: hypothetical protein AVDCRST_MAG09-1192 [uncultured Sphingomonas sp.]|uniref:Reverse transcriptase domain-containing protein n=1 Tax=uncultured Sphingomonas sp. TaxID=158754 RepID=A0A6J4SY79_9SPHN|nr:hypothetical protein [uncultured Sphingomonas sp.]CAA9508173.1 MAG: hypothetical protein AVDCRST_MAG09-1192 [uncultured Sphingomonas sp.]